MDSYVIYIFSFAVTKNAEVKVLEHVHRCNYIDTKKNFWVKMNIHLKC